MVNDNLKKLFYFEIIKKAPHSKIWLSVYIINRLASNDNISEASKA